MSQRRLPHKKPLTHTVGTQAESCSEEDSRQHTTHFTNNSPNLWKYLRRTKTSGHHVQRTRRAANHLPGEVSPSRLFCHFSLGMGSHYPLCDQKITHILMWYMWMKLLSSLVTSSLSLSLQGEGAQSSVWEFTTEVRSQHHWTVKEM